MNNMNYLARVHPRPIFLPAMLGVAILAILLSVTLATADILPPDMRVAHREIMIENIQEHPDFVFVVFDLFGDEVRDRYLVKPETPLTQGYKFNVLRLAAVPVAYFEEKGLSALLPSDPRLLFADYTFAPVAILVPQDSTLQSEKQIIRIAGFKEGVPVLYLARRIQDYGPDAKQSVSKSPAPKLEE